MLGLLDEDELDAALTIAVHVQRLITCPISGVVMDVRRAVLLVADGQQLVCDRDAFTDTARRRLDEVPGGWVSWDGAALWAKMAGDPDAVPFFTGEVSR